MQVRMSIAHDMKCWQSALNGHTSGKHLTMYWRALLAGTTWIEPKCFVELGPDKNMHKNVQMWLENWCIQLLYHLREKKRTECTQQLFSDLHIHWQPHLKLTMNLHSTDCSLQGRGEEDTVMYVGMTVYL